MITDAIWYGLGWLIPLLYAVGALMAMHAIRGVRTSQGAIAWALSLLTIPYVAVPLYLLVGRSRFFGYVESRRAGNLAIHELARGVVAGLAPFENSAEPLARLLQNLVGLPCTTGNRAQLLINGEETFAAMLEEIAQATDYILVEFFIVHRDRIGNAFKEALIAKAREGVRVYFLFDAVGSRTLSKTYVRELRDAGVAVSSFRSTRGWRQRFQINFRNHRKIAIMDGRSAFLGGLNVGDEYLGRSPRFGYWRDTHLKLEGPGVQCAQLAFLEDWYWAHGEIPELRWDSASPDDGDSMTIVLPTGPADTVAACELGFIASINSASRRFWITSPYFVPGPATVVALKLAVLRGVDVRIMLPDRPDHLLVYLSAFSFYGEMLPAGVKLYRFQPGFMHQKVLLIDDEWAAVGTVNLDNRSFYLNFEITAFLRGQRILHEISQVLEEDFSCCREVTLADYTDRPIWFRAAVRIARLLAPVQ